LGGVDRIVENSGGELAIWQGHRMVAGRIAVALSLTGDVDGRIVVVLEKTATELWSYFRGLEIAADRIAVAVSLTGDVYGRIIVVLLWTGDVYGRIAVVHLIRW